MLTLLLYLGSSTLFVCTYTTITAALPFAVRTTNGPFVVQATLYSPCLRRCLPKHLVRNGGFGVGGCLPRGVSAFLVVYFFLAERAKQTLTNTSQYLHGNSHWLVVLICRGVLQGRNRGCCWAGQQ